MRNTLTSQGESFEERGAKPASQAGTSNRIPPLDTVFEVDYRLLAARGYAGEARKDEVATNRILVRDFVMPIRIGARTNIQDNAVVHVTGGLSSATIGDDVTVGHSAIIHGCTVGNRCLVGMGSIVLDNAVIEDEGFVAAGSLVPPGARIASRFMAVGRPAKQLRALEDRDLIEIAGASALYVQYARDFKSELKLEIDPR